MEQIEATLTNVSAVTTPAATILAATLLRCGASIHNDSTSACYVKMGSAASPTDFTVKLEAGDHYELPIVIGGNGRSIYTGVVTAVWDVATGTARVTEYT